MHNLEQLEKRWFIYKAKKYIPIALLTVLVTIALIVTLLFKSDVKKELAVKKDNIIKKDEPIVPVSFVENVVIKEKREEYAPLVLQPSMSFMEKIKSSEQEKTVPVKKVQPVEKIKITKAKSVTKHTKITEYELLTLENRFAKSSSATLGLFIAKYYYKNKEYKNSAEYALKVNELNPNLEESWMIFASSLAKNGKKDDAIQVLKKYIDKTHSSNATTLLKDIIKGKFK
ncbi:MAG: hypothetical protein GQ570_06325 [Helicobacteraceae bacterium]|nr:hypothetical protein [Helicobacteraceae bacterium]